MILFNTHQDIYKKLIEYITEKEYSSIFVLCDTNTKKKCWNILSKELYIVLSNIRVIEVNTGEEFKNIQTCNKIWSNLLNAGCDRKSLLINLGGGVITDIGGFTASVFKRGIDFINIPTSLLAMADASVGGKTGIDFDGVKNIIGSFSQPEMTIIDLKYLDTLETRELKSGFAEMLKHGLIVDKNHWKKLIYTKYNHITYDLLKDSVNIKKRIVKNDPYESKERKLLNFGHSIGHGVESYSLKYDKQPVSHGEAVAIGMIIESYISLKMNLLCLDEFKIIEQKIIEFFGVYKLKPSSFDEIIEFIKNDKKNRNNNFYFVLLTSIGNAEYDVKIESNLIYDAFKYYSTLKEVI